ncbi:hypothetical protein [Rhodococcus sp. T7]|uniref:hypothetical protein n=1 Tax=Rhodococcus sp. T7 TaxID=627444 RepID=UPI00135C753A|nr:hypothetical protein [Rhodococcus sp. T7]KAF0957390.1 hypothetical protein MLGJGCBP_09222 [Rhodococcus sp. T7]KAF0962139.1 hypothetical protein MLGJGCBP_04760 [Rhodococcus sp. T7]
MATLSVREIAETALGRTGNLSVNTDVYGYIFRDTDGSLFGTLDADDTLPGTGQPTTRSLKRHLQTISGDATDLVVFLVGHENDFSGVVSRDEVTTAQYALQVARDLYAQVDLGIRRIKWMRIPLAEANPAYIDIYSRTFAGWLTADFSGPDGGIDLFLVQTWAGDTAGRSAVRGPCDKNEKFEWTGAVLELSLPRRITGILLGHEVGHYLGLEHSGPATNMMNKSSFNTSTDITARQGERMRSHCSVSKVGVF